MGVPFIEHPGGRKFFVCRACECPIASASVQNVCVESTHRPFHTSKVLLFKKIVNTTKNSSYHQKADERGAHTSGKKKMIRDVHCRKCQVKLGWFNEFIEDTNQVTPQISEKNFL